MSRTSRKQAKLLPAGAQLTGPVLHALVGAFRRALGATAPSLESVAGTVAAATTSRQVLQSCDILSTMCVASLVLANQPCASFPGRGLLQDCGNSNP